MNIIDNYMRYYHSSFLVYIGICIVFGACTEKPRVSEATSEPLKEPALSEKKAPKKEGKDKATVQETSFEIVVEPIQYRKASKNKSAKSAKVKIPKHKVERILTVKIGEESDQLGCDGRSPEWVIGPCSFTVDEEERIYIVDPVNTRIQIYFKGVRESKIPIDIQDRGDIQVLPNGDIVFVADRQYGLSVTDRKGNLKAKFLYSLGDLFVQPDGIWLEGYHAIEMVLNRRYQRPSEPSILPDRLPTRDGKWLINFFPSPKDQNLTIVLCDREQMANKMRSLYGVYNRPRFCYEGDANEHLTAEFQFDKDFEDWSDGGTDAKGNIHILAFYGSGPKRHRRTSCYLTTISPDLEIIRRTEIRIHTVNKSADNIWREFEVTANGNVYTMDSDKDFKEIYITRYQ